jgi:glutamine synthetase
MEALNKQALRILRLLGDTKATRVLSTVGAEQEYFLIDKSVYEKRRDLIYCGRTLFGAKPPKGQELDDHYFGTIRPRVAAFMKDLDEELWKLGIPAKTKHNEVAPAQHELAPVFTTSNIAADHNQLTMELMKRVAGKHGMECLLHEKPFAGINGSGKHNNWSLTTNTGENLLDPREPRENLQFLLFLAAVIQAVDDHQDLLRAAVATAGNDHRLGANEAPPAIISIFLGSELEAVLQSVEADTEYVGVDKSTLEMGVDVLPGFMKDTEDRNRTSPFAFTGNKFEFRMPGSSLSISGPNFVLNTIVADALAQFADVLEGAEDLRAEAFTLIRRVVTGHKRILFNGNNYSDEWVAEAERRGLLNLKSTADALPLFVSGKNIALFTKHGVLTEAEMHSRLELLLEGYCKTLNIEAVTMLQMSKKSIIPAVSGYTGDLAESANAKLRLSAEIDCRAEQKLAVELSRSLGCFLEAVDALDSALIGAKDNQDAETCARYYADTVFPAMQNLRAISDSMEIITSKLRWPWPTYGDILYSV